MKTFPVDTHFQDDSCPSPPTWNQTSFHVITLHWFASLFCSVLLFSLPFHWGCHPVTSLRAVFENLSSKSSLLCRDPGSRISHVDVKMQTLWLWSLAQHPTSPVMYEMVVEGAARNWSRLCGFQEFPLQCCKLSEGGGMVPRFSRVRDERFISQMEIRLYVLSNINKILIHIANQIALFSSGFFLLENKRSRL